MGSKRPARLCSWHFVRSRISWRLACLYSRRMAARLARLLALEIKRMAHKIVRQKGSDSLTPSKWLATFCPLMTTIGDPPLTWIAPKYNAEISLHSFDRRKLNKKYRKKTAVF